MRTLLKPNRRQLLSGAGAAAGALLLNQSGLNAQAAPNKTVVFTHTTVVTTASVHDDVALAVNGKMIAAIGPTDAILKTYPDAEVYDGSGKALLPGLINCHAHLAATLARGFNEDFGFPNSAKLAIQPNSLFSNEEATLMVVVGALESHPLREHHGGRECGKHWQIRRSVGADGAALGVRGIRH